MLVRQIGVVGVAGGLAGPVEQRHVQQAVDDVAVVVGSAERAPRLKELALLLKVGVQSWSAAKIAALLPFSLPVSL